MAVDTADERYSLLNMCLPFGRTLHVPDGTIGADDRQFFLLLYVGILWGEPVVVAAVAPARFGGGPVTKRHPEDRWYERVGERAERDRRRRAKALALQEKVVARAEHGAYMAQAEKVVDAWIKANREEEEAAKRRVAEKAIRDAKLLKQRLMNLEKAKLAKEKKRKLEEEKRKRLLKNLGKARAAKKRKKKGK